MPMPEATISLPVNATATAFSEGLHLELDVKVSSDGQHTVYMWGRKTGTGKMKLLATFDAYEWERFKKMLAAADELLKKIEAGGAVFKIG